MTNSINFIEINTSTFIPSNENEALSLQVRINSDLKLKANNMCFVDYRKVEVTETFSIESVEVVVGCFATAAEIAKLRGISEDKIESNWKYNNHSFYIND